MYVTVVNCSIYIYIYVSICMYISIYVYIYINMYIDIMYWYVVFPSLDKVRFLSSGKRRTNSWTWWNSSGFHTHDLERNGSKFTIPILGSPKMTPYDLTPVGYSHPEGGSARSCCAPKQHPATCLLCKMMIVHRNGRDLSWSNYMLSWRNISWIFQQRITEIY